MLLGELMVHLLPPLAVANPPPDPQKDGDADQKACKKAVTRWEVANATNTHAHLILMPETGRKHQLRVVCSDLLGGPIVGDFKYGYQGPPAGSGHLLHCFSLEFYVSLERLVAAVARSWSCSPPALDHFGSEYCPIPCRRSGESQGGGQQ